MDSHLAVLSFHPPVSACICALFCTGKWLPFMFYLNFIIAISEIHSLVKLITITKSQTLLLLDLKILAVWGI